MHLTMVDRLFWAAGLFGHCALLAVLAFRHRAPLFPAFTTLISADIVRTVLLYFMLRFGSSESYFYSYWTLAIVDVALQLAVVYEVATHVFRPLGAWAPDVRRTFAGLAAASVVLASILTRLASPPTRTLRLAVVIRGNFFSSALMSELFVVMVALSVTVGLPWRTHVARLAQGLGVYSLFGVLTEGAHSYLGSAPGTASYAFLSHVRITLYLLCVTYWIVAFAKKEPVPRKLPEHVHQELRELQRRAALVLQTMRTTGSA